MASWILIVIFAVVGWFALFIWMWVKGVSDRNSTMTIIGALFSLGFIGLIIALVQVSGWNNETHYQSQFEIEKAKLALEREKLELDKMKHEHDKKKKS